MSIKKQFLLTMLILFTIPLLVGPTIGYIYIKETTQEQLLLQNEQNLDWIVKDLNNVLEEIISASNAIVLNTEIVSSLKENDRGVQKVKKAEEGISNINAAQLFSYNADIYIYDLEGEIYATTAGQDRIIVNEYKEQWIEDTLEMKGLFNWNYFTYNMDERKEEYPVLGVARNILDINGKTVGVLSIEILNERKMSNMLYTDTEYPNTERYLINGQGNIILSYQSHNDQPQIYQKQWGEGYKESINKKGYLSIKFNGEDQIILNKDLHKTKWSIIQITPYKEVFKKLLRYRNFTIAINIGFLVVILALAVIGANRLTKSIIKLRDAMKSVKKGKFINIEIEKSSKEIEDLTDEFNIMSTKLDYLFKENQRIFNEKQRTKLEALHMQIQPHFLFNTLNGIKWLCAIEGAQMAEKMLVSLGYILEYSLSKNKEFNTLEEEIICLEHYIEIQKMRYGETFVVDIQTEKNLNTMKVPTLFLQPLVENAIIHGLQNKEGWGQISIKAWQEGKQVLISVKDNGWGMSQDQVEKLSSLKNEQSGIGVINVRQRIKLYYGHESDLFINSTQGIGTEIVLKLVRQEALSDENHYSR